MRVYELRIIRGDLEYGRYLFEGNNGMEAFENAEEAGVFYIDAGVVYEIIAVNISTRLAVKFDAMIGT